MNTSPLGIFLCQGPVSGDMLSRTWGAWGTHLPPFATLQPGGTGTVTALCPTGHGDNSVSLLGMTSCTVRHRDSSVSTMGTTVPLGMGTAQCPCVSCVPPLGTKVTLWPQWAGDGQPTVPSGQLEWLCDTMECDTSWSH